MANIKGGGLPGRECLAVEHISKKIKGPQASERDSFDTPFLAFT